MIDWTQVDTVLLDMDGTLLDLHFDNYFWMEHLPKRYAEVHRVEEMVARERLIEMMTRERGSLNWYCVDYWSEQLAVDIAALKREVSHLIAVRPYALEFLRQLKAAGKVVLLVTNAHAKSLHLKLEHTDIGPYFDAVVSSHDFHLPKEQPEFWVKLRQAYPFDPARTLFIDDTASVLRSAEHFGIRYLLTLLQPDSQQLPREVTDYPGFHHFDAIMPQAGPAFGDSGYG